MVDFPEALSFLTVGFLFGFKHAFDADHVAAVSLLNTRLKNPRGSLKSGLFWGFGHMATLLVIGSTMFIFRIQFSENVSSFFEIVVSLFLISYGLYSFIDFWKTRKRNRMKGIIEHQHPPMGLHRHPYPSFFVGVIHGLAGSAAIMLLIISAIHSALIGLLYLSIFGLGSIVGMVLVSFSFGIGAKYFQKVIVPLSSLFSLGTGIFLLGRFFIL